MSDILKDKLSWFLKNLELLLDDLKWEREFRSVDLYFDTLDIKHAVLGLEGLYHAGAYDVRDSFPPRNNKPLRDRALVLGLAFSGRLGTIKMLPPHQSEFLALLNKNFQIHQKLPPKQMALQFLRAVSQTESIRQEASILKEADEEKTLEYVREHAGSAANFFKIIQLVRGTTWQERFVNLRNANILELRSYEIDYKDIVSSSEFRALYETFGDLRRTRSAANFADAVSLAILTQHLSRMKSGLSTSIPRFYVSSESPGATPLFLTAVEKAGLADLFSYGDSNRTSVLRESDYFVFRSIFETASRSENGINDGTAGWDFTELSALREDLSGILKSSSFIQPEQLASINLAGKNIAQVMDDLNTFLFFTNVWLPSSREEVDFAVQDLRAAADELKSESFTHTVSEGIAEAKTILEKNVAQYQIVRQMWEEIETATKSLQDEKFPEDIDYSRDFGLLRFSFPASAYKRINHVLEDLLTGSVEEGNLTHSNVITACYMAHILSKEKYIDDVAAAAAVLWVAERYRDLVKLLSHINPLPHFSLEIIYAAAIFEAHEQESRGRGILKHLKHKHRRATELQEKSNLAVGLAYLHFHYWRLLGHGPAWDQEDVERISRDPEKGKDLICQAIELALEAYTGLGEQEMRKKVYALNQYLYYMIMADDPSLISELNKAADKLLRYKEQGDRDWWQHRFDDTLARYYYSLAAAADERDTWDEYTLKALEYSNQAFKRAPWDRVSRTFKDRLENRRRRGFGDRRPTQ